MDANKADSMIKDSCNYNLLRHNTFGMNVKCARFLEFSTIDDLREITSQRDIVDKPMLILGGGSNVLFVGDFPGTILHSGIKGIELIQDEDTACLRCGSGEVTMPENSVFQLRLLHGSANFQIGRSCCRLSLLKHR